MKRTKKTPKRLLAVMRLNYPPLGPFMREMVKHENKLAKQARKKQDNTVYELGFCLKVTNEELKEWERHEWYKARSK